MEESNHRIAYALYFDGKWKYGKDDPEILDFYGVRTTPEEYTPDMKGKIFCPRCRTPLSRSPQKDAITTNRRTVHYRHLPTFIKVPCLLRTPGKRGSLFKNEEEVRKAIESEDLAIVSSWMDKPPEISTSIDDHGEFDQTAIEDAEGPVSEVPIGRHVGESVMVPSRISSVAALCWRFDQNLNRAYYLPGSQYPLLLTDILYDVDRITERGDEEPERLYFGKIVSYQKLTLRSAITVECEPFGCFKLYTWPALDERKHIGDNSVGRWIVFSAAIYWEGGSVPAYKVNQWGRYSLLPAKYEKYLEPLKKR